MAGFQVIPLGKGIYVPRSGAVANQRLRNLYAEPNEEGARYPFTLYGTPGLAAWSSVGVAPIRGIHQFGSDLYVVAKDTLYIVDVATKVATNAGRITGNGRVRMADNGTHVAIATSADAYAANRDGLISLPEGNFSDVDYQDGYLIWTRRGDQTFYISGLDDATTIDPLDFSSADVIMDNIVGVVCNHREPWMMGERSVEVFANTGDAAFPFSRVSYIERGCASVGSIAKFERSVIWLDNNLRVCMAVGYQPQTISTPAIEKLIAAATEPNSSEAFVYTQGGHSFYMLSFNDLSLSYDFTTGLWHERISQNEDRWRADAYAYFDSRKLHLVADFETNDIYELDLDTYSDNGDEIIRECPFSLRSGANWGFLQELVIDMETGVGLTLGQGSAPVANLDWSEDDGRTWSNPVERSMGIMGNHRTRVNFTRLGRFRNREFRLRISDPVKVAILGAEARVDLAAA
jgi:hypothetical protein